jgi:hypothetical protein
MDGSPPHPASRGLDTIRRVRAGGELLFNLLSERYETR